MMMIRDHHVVIRMIVASNDNNVNILHMTDEDVILFVSLPVLGDSLVSQEILILPDLSL